MTDPKREGIDTERSEDNWGPGERADGSLNTIAPEDLAASVAQRDADESAFAAMLEGIDPDDLSDLDDEYDF